MTNVLLAQFSNGERLTAAARAALKQELSRA